MSSPAAIQPTILRLPRPLLQAVCGLLQAFCRLLRAAPWRGVRGARWCRNGCCYGALVHTGQVKAGQGRTTERWRARDWETGRVSRSRTANRSRSASIRSKRSSTMYTDFVSSPGATMSCQSQKATIAVQWYIVSRGNNTYKGWKQEEELRAW